MRLFGRRVAGSPAGGLRDGLLYEVTTVELARLLRPFARDRVRTSEPGDGVVWGAWGHRR